ncbi:hypothetical protein GCM10011514_30250 [Emticicia aquatilis]|uniref:Uncharacterized protein n=1 Tax=Emticicia aquatilis TaxID=1537369 RepID=A0A917DRW7_9BACT|nr:hypothetical protein [Emticicia aquatilis]GGD64238.1 hypothetical protein GCM10011514_30250 [Emticicia aquatilis]
MSHGFKLRFDEMRESDPTNLDATQKNETDDFYQNLGHARNICFIWSDERRMFLNYAYLIAGEFNPNNEKNLIKLIFSSHTVLLHGYHLETLYTALLDHLPRFIREVDARYALSDESKEGIVIEIIIEKKET